MHDEQWFIERYDGYVASEVDGASLEKSRDAVAQAYVSAVEAGEIERWREDITEEGRYLFDRIVKPTREKRRNSMRKSMDYLLDALRGDTILGPNDPVFVLAYPLGDGTDKTLGNWSQDDWRNATTERYRNAASATEAARQFDLAASQIADAMASRGVATTAAAFRRTDA